MLEWLCSTTQRIGGWTNEGNVQRARHSHHIIGTLLTVFEWDSRTICRRCNKWHKGHVAGLRPPTSIPGGGNVNFHVPAEQDADIRRRISSSTT